jgi:hypothetical protein
VLNGTKLMPDGMALAASPFIETRQHRLQIGHLLVGQTESDARHGMGEVGGAERALERRGEATMTAVPGVL